MALDKNKNGIMAAISAASVGKAPIGDRAHRALPRGTVGSVRASLGGIQDIDTDLIRSWGPVDRLELTAVHTDQVSGDDHDLVESIRTNGQQVPVLLRPSAEHDGQFDVIYGRRRIDACRTLGVPVKALIRTLDDTEALMAKGLENASRVELSFYERARFAQGILDQGHSREEVLQALAISKNTLSQLERVTRLVPSHVGEAIGAAPGSGRPKWMTLAAAYEDGKASDAQVMQVIVEQPEDAGSDARLQAVLDALAKRGAQGPRDNDRSPMNGVAVKSAKSAVTVTVKRAGENKAFADWLDANIDRVLHETYARFEVERAEAERQ